MTTFLNQFSKNQSWEFHGDVAWRKGRKPNYFLYFSQLPHWLKSSWERTCRGENGIDGSIIIKWIWVTISGQFFCAGKRATTDIEDDWQMMCLCPYSQRAAKKKKENLRKHPLPYWKWNQGRHYQRNKQGKEEACSTLLYNSQNFSV